MVLSLKTLLCVGCGCFAGGVLRYLTSYFICTRWGITAADMPWHTLIINYGGCLFMGLFCGLATAGFIESPNLRLALTAGLCGGYSTLAAFAFENTMLLRSGHLLHHRRLHPRHTRRQPPLLCGRLCPRQYPLPESLKGAYL